MQTYHATLQFLRLFLSGTLYLCYTLLEFLLEFFYHLLLDFSFESVRFTVEHYLSNIKSQVISLFQVIQQFFSFLKNKVASKGNSTYL